VDLPRDRGGPIHRGNTLDDGRRRRPIGRVEAHEVLHQRPERAAAGVAGVAPQPLDARRVPRQRTELAVCGRHDGEGRHVGNNDTEAPHVIARGEGSRLAGLRWQVPAVAPFHGGAGRCDEGAARPPRLTDVPDSWARELPKSESIGPLAPNRTLLGFRSPWSNPRLWT